MRWKEQWRMINGLMEPNWWPTVFLSPDRAFHTFVPSLSILMHSSCLLQRRRITKSGPHPACPPTPGWLHAGNHPGFFFNITTRNMFIFHFATTLLNQNRSFFNNFLKPLGFHFIIHSFYVIMRNLINQQTKRRPRTNERTTNDRSMCQVNILRKKIKNLKKKKTF